MHLMNYFPNLIIFICGFMIAFSMMIYQLYLVLPFSFLHTIQLTYYTLFEFLQRFSHPKYFSNDVMANGLTFHHGDPVSSVNDSFSSYLASAPPEEQKKLLGNRLYPLVERHQVISCFFLSCIFHP